MKTSSIQLSKSLQSALKSYPIPLADRTILNRALAFALKPRLKVWPMWIAAGIGLIVFLLMLQAITTDYASGVLSMAYYVSLPLTLILTAAATLLKLSMEYGNWLLTGTMLFIGFELFLNRKCLLHIFFSTEKIST